MWDQDEMQHQGAKRTRKNTSREILSAGFALVRSCCLVLLVAAVLFQPAMALVGSVGPGAARVELSEADQCSMTCCCSSPAAMPVDETGCRTPTAATRRCTCNARPSVPADAPLPLFAPTSSSDHDGQRLVERITLAAGTYLVSAWSEVPATDLERSRFPELSLERARAGPSSRLLPRGLNTFLAFLSTARL